MIKELRTSLEVYANRNAFCIGDVYYTYRELSQVVGRIQAGIRELAAAAGTGRVGIVTTDSIETYASILAAWFMGYAYVPLHPKNPDDRNKTIIREANIDLVLTAGMTKPGVGDAGSGTGEAGSGAGDAEAGNGVTEWGE